MNGYNQKSCNALEKPFYRPVEAAIRWCGLIEHEAEILTALNGVMLPSVGQFPGWDCLRPNTEKIIDAINRGDIPHGREGKDVVHGTQVTPAKRTVRHLDLREWMRKHAPQSQWPAFLFDEIERSTHELCTVEAMQIMQAERDAAKADAQKLRADAETTGFQIAALEKQIAALNAKLQAAGAPAEQSEKTYLNIIGGLLAVMLGKSPAGKPQSSFDNQGSIISVMLGHYGQIKGMGDSNLEKIMARANKTLKDSTLTVV